MSVSRSVLVPIDFSDASRGALRYATALAHHLEAELRVVTVADPLLMEAALLRMSADEVTAAVRKDLEAFCRDTLEGSSVRPNIRFEIATGKPAVEILRLSHNPPATVIVMSTQGLTGARKLFFGSTTERVLRETTVPTLLTPPHNPGTVRIDEIKRGVRRVLIPVDLSSDLELQLAAGRAIASTLGASILLTFVVEPLRFALTGLGHLPNIDAERRYQAEQRLAELAGTLPDEQPVEALVVHGDPAEEIAKVARDRNAGLIIMGLHSSSMLGPRMGSVTYRVLCLTSTFVLALPPASELTTT